MSVLSGENIVCFTRRSWQSTWKTDQQIMSRLARSNRVLYVNPPRRLREAVCEAVGLTPRAATVSAQGRGLYVYQEPIYLPGWGKSYRISRAYHHIAHRLRVAHLRRTMKRLRFDSPILWSFDPLAAWAIGKFGQKLFIYSVIDNYDEYFSAGEIWQTEVRKSHCDLMRHADLVFAVSEPLLERCLSYNPNSFLVPNGVSFEVFQEAMQKSHLPHEIRGIPRPIIGFAGVLHSSIDFDLLEEIASGRADWSLVMVGPVEGAADEDLETFSRIRHRRNVYYLGPKAPDELPEYIKCFDVGLMPYRMGPLTAFGDSLKLYEYLACGKPVVSTAVPTAQRFASLVAVAEDHSSFVSAVDKVLKEPDGFRETRIAVARDNSWDRRISDMSTIVLARLVGRTAFGGIGYSNA